MKHLFIYGIFLLSISVGIIACDPTAGPEDILKDSPSITNLEISPSEVVFSSQNDGIKDTTVQVSFEVSVLNPGVSRQLTLSIIDRNSNDVVVQQTLDESSTDNQYQATVSFETRTTFFNEYVVYVRFANNFNSSYAQGNLNIIGFSLVAPEILSANNPSSVSRPSSETNLYRFTAKVTDQEGIDTIEGVFVRIFNRATGEVNSSPFTLYDDGSNGEDVSAGDSVYTAAFPVNPESQLQTFDLLYYAVDKGGLVSDTVQTTFTITQ